MSTLWNLGSGLAFCYFSFRATAGIERAHPCLTVDWVLGQFGRRFSTAVKRYKEFVMAGIGMDGLWEEVKGQLVLGREEFVEEILKHVEQSRKAKEIPKVQRHFDRPALEKLFTEEVLKDKDKRNEMIYKAVMEHGYSQTEVAEVVGIHYSRVSRIVRREEIAKGKT